MDSSDDLFVIHVRHARTGGYIAKLLKRIDDREIIHGIAAAPTIDMALRSLNFDGDAPVYFEEQSNDLLQAA
jgi:hypothetical protein